MENEWSLEDDLKLIDGLLHCGYGNWTDIAARINNRSPLECKNHYLDKFIDNPDNNDLKEIIKNSGYIRIQPSLCSNSNLCVDIKEKSNQSLVQILEVEDFIREVDNDNSINNSVKPLAEDESNSDKLLNSSRRTRDFSSNLVTCTTYNSCRSEFQVEYDDNAENILEILGEHPENIKFTRNEDSDLMESMRCVLAESYNFRLRERINRKNVIRRHGLIDMRKTYSMIQRIKVPFGSSFISSLLPFMKFFCGPELDYLVEKLCYEKELRNRVNSLLTYRSLGIRFLNGIHTYENLHKKRLKYKEQIGYNGEPLLVDDISEIRNCRRPSAPLTLYNLPGFHLLNEDEKQLCSSSRIVPETYCSFKKLLISECRKHRGLKLAQARQLLKIDVNKTRKMFDYLISTGDIW